LVLTALFIAGLAANAYLRPGRARLRVGQAPPAHFRIDLNKASEDELMLLPGIGQARARRIVELRQRRGRVESLDELVREKILPAAVARELRAKDLVEPEEGR